MAASGGIPVCLSSLVTLIFIFSGDVVAVGDGRVDGDVKPFFLKKGQTVRKLHLS